MQLKLVFYKARQRGACVHVAEFEMAAPYGSEKYWLRLYITVSWLRSHSDHSSEILTNTVISLN